MRDFYATAAQVLPVILLALVWESRYFEQLRLRQKSSRSPAGNDTFRFWTLPRVRIYSLFVAGVIVVAIAICLLVLGGFVGSSGALRGIVTAGVALALASLLYRVCVHIISSTNPSAYERGRVDQQLDDAA